MMMNKNTRVFIMLGLVVLGFILVVTGHKSHSYMGLSVQLIGVAFVLTSLYIYNKQYQ